MSCNGMASSFFPPNFLLQMQTPHGEEQEHHPPSSLTPFLLTNSFKNPHGFHGVATLQGNRSMSFSGAEEMNGEDDTSDDCSQAGEKKRRLNMEQVKKLEKSFELGNKLEPERKMHLARTLGLQPRQIAIWFQNRRARWKTKQLEKDYGVLKREFDAVRSENDALHAQNKKLQAEIMAIKGREAAAEPMINLNKETEGSCSNRSENSSDVNLDTSRTPPAAINSTLNTHQSRPFFHSIRPAELHCPKVEHGVQDENFCNMFCSFDDQSGFWTWSEQHSFH